MKKIFATIAVCLVVLLTAAFLLYQYLAFREPTIVTEKVIYDTIYEDITSTGMVLRSETVLSQPVDGVVDYACEDGQRVSSGSVIARVYGNQSDVYRSEEAKKLEERIAKLEACQESQGGSMDAKTLEQQIEKEIVKLTREGADGNVANAAQEADNLELLLLQRRLLLREVTSLEPQIAQLQQELEELRAGISQSTQSIYAPQAGYLVRKVDGFEGELPLADKYSCTAADLKPLLEREEQVSSVVGFNAKLVDQFLVDLAFVVPAADVEDLEVGKTVQLKFAFALDESMTATIKYISSEEGSDRVLILRCKELPYELLSQRKHTVQIIKKSYSGLRINNDAIRMDEEGTPGVYAVIGNLLTFKPIEILHPGPNYTIVKMDNETKGSLLLYDEVVVQGKELYDGKIVR